jgi:6-phosphogluconolactonase (cycloisomerase 2 family)
MMFIGTFSVCPDTGGSLMKTTSVLKRRTFSDLPTFERMENRRLMSVGFGETTYIETNNPNPGQNAVIQLKLNPATGELTQAGTYYTGGTGQGNPTQKLGPNDSDKEVIVSDDGSLLFAVNQGSDSITVFRIRRNGNLSKVGTYDSFGDQPVSLALADDKLIVTNRGDALQGATATVAANITVFKVRDDGSLKHIDNSTVNFPIGLSPSQVEVSRDGKFVFSDNFAIPGTSPAMANTLEAFRITNKGQLESVAGGLVTADVASPTLLGLATHPTQRIIYAGLVASNQIAVFTYDKHGALTFVTAVNDLGGGPCWTTVSDDGKFLYEANTGTVSVAVYSLADPLHPVQIQEFALQQPAPPPGATKAPLGAFEFSLDPSGHVLDVLTQSTAANLDFPEGNAIHSLLVAPSGILSEPNAPVTFSTSQVPGEARIQGVAIVATGRYGFPHGDDRPGHRWLFSDDLIS